MKKKEHDATHDDYCLTYFPYYNDGKFLFILLSVGLLILVIVYVCILCFDASGNSTLPTLMGMFSIIVVTFPILIILYRKMADEFVLTRDAVLYRNARKKIQVEILWESVSKVTFRQDAWRGDKICTLWLKTTDNNAPSRKRVFVIPVHSVNQTELLSFIPASLFAEDPKYKWFS